MCEMKEKAKNKAKARTQRKNEKPRKNLIKIKWEQDKFNGIQRKKEIDNM